VTRLAMLAVLATGCSSLVSDPCQPGYDLVDGSCEMINIAPPPTGVVPPPLPEPAPTQPTVPLCFAPQTDCDGICTDLQSDPDNCGSCGIVCASGLCDAGVCVGATVGHVVAIGHDYQASEPAMDRVLADAVGLTTGAFTRIGYYQGTSTLEGAQAAAVVGLAQTSRMASAAELADLSRASLDEIDAVVIEPQLGDGNAAEAVGAAAAQTLADFLAEGHVVVVLETTGGVSYRLADGAGLFTVSAPVDATGTAISVAAPADAVADGVASPYLGRTETVGYPGVANPVFVDTSNDAVVFHLTY
jgi:hypothetical protein